jgi:hypothetical protein
VGLLLLLLLLGWFPLREDGKGALNVVVVSGTLSGLDVCVATEGLLMGLSAADGVEGGEGDYCPDAGVDGGGGGGGQPQVGGLDLGAWGKVVLEEVAGCHCYVAGPETVVAESEEGVRADWCSPPAATFFGGFEFSLHKLLQLPLAGWWKEEEAPQHLLL